jgi:hypothetical protein
VIGGSIGTALLALAPLIPLVTMQDAYRHGFLARGDAASACWSDGVWLVGAVAGLMILRRADHDSLVLSVGFAIGAAGLGLLVALARAAVLPSWSSTRWAFERWWRIAVRLSGEFGVAITSNLAALVLVTAWNADLQQAGSLRSAQVLLGPLAVFFAAVGLYTQPLMVERHRGGRSVVSLARRQTVVCVIVAVAWIVVAANVPAEIGTRIFGASWAGLSDIIVVVGVAFVGLAISSGAMTALRSRGQINAGLATQTMVAVVVLATTVAGGLLVSEGTLRGFAVGNVLASIVVWLMFTYLPVNDMVSPSSRQLQAGGAASG